jgi:signal transduction histidine kinase
MKRKVKISALKPKKAQYDAFLRVTLALVITFLICQFPFDYIESIFYDARVRIKPVSPQSGHIEIIAVDPDTVEKFHRVPNARDHIQLFNKLQSAEIRAMVYLINPNEIVGSYDELQELSSLWKKQQNFVVAINDTALRGESDAFKLLPPFEQIAALSSQITSDLKRFAGDDVTRRMFISYQQQLALEPTIAGLFNPDAKNEKKIRGLFELLGSNQTYIDYRPTGTYPTMGFAKVLETSSNTERFKDKIVIVGRDIQTTSKDYVRTPFSRDSVAMPLIELHANMLDTLILNSAPVRTPYWFNFVITAIISILTVYFVTILKPTRGLTLIGVTIVGFFLIGFLLFWLGGIWINMAQPFLAIFISYYFFIPYRLILENQKSWALYEKNKLLTQVEELKTNFLSMMSHDLKTPIARIQGMTDIVLQDSDRLTPRQREALTTLSKSSQELLEFVSSILNLGRIESKEFELHLQSRDPNKLLEEAAEKLEHLARSKNIKIVSELEPLFSVKMDVDLMRQVLSNLIENAIKYSPENSSILLTTEEADGKVIIQVADQGRGIEEAELPYVFDKFYRSKSVKNSATKGSGLGLYLAKYFVELHSGTISVDSRPGVGSTFTVELPTAPAH